MDKATQRLNTEIADALAERDAEREWIAEANRLYRIRGYRFLEFGHRDYLEAGHYGESSEEFIERVTCDRDHEEFEKTAGCLYCGDPMCDGDCAFDDLNDWDDACPWCRDPLCPGDCRDVEVLRMLEW